MAIENGAIADADEVMFAFVKYQGINNGQNFINAMKVASPLTDYTFIKGRHFVCNQGNVGVELGSGTGCYSFKNASFCDGFETIGCWCDVSPTCDIGSVSGNVCSHVVAGNCLLLCGSSTSGSSVSLTHNVGGADYYSFCWCGNSSVGCPVGTPGVTICWNFLGNLICNCSVSGCSNHNITIPWAHYEFCKVAGSNDYCFFKNSVFQCCVTGSGTTNSWSASGGGWTLTQSRTRLIFKSPFESSKLNPTCLRTSQFTFPETPDFFVATAFKSEPADGCMKYDLLCASTNAILCSGMDFDTPYNIESLGKDTYKLQMYNCCFVGPNGGTATVHGWAATGAVR